MCIEAAPFHVDTLALCNHVSPQSKLLLNYLQAAVVCCWLCFLGMDLCAKQ